MGQRWRELAGPESHLPGYVSVCLWVHIVGIIQTDGQKDRQTDKQTYRTPEQAPFSLILKFSDNVFYHVRG